LCPLFLNITGAEAKFSWL